MKFGQGPPPSGGWKLLMPGDGSDPDYSPAYQDEYQRLWHEAAARAEAAEALAERRRAGLQAIIDYVPEGFISPMDDEDSMNYRAIARAALAEDASHQDAGEPGYGGVCGKEQTA